MKMLSIFVLILLLVFIGIVIFGGKSEAPIENEPETEPVVETNRTLEGIKENGMYTINTEKSIIKWTGRKKIVTNWVDTGTIKIQSGQANMENSNIKNAELIIDMSSISTDTTGSGSGQDSLTNHLKSEDFFDVEKYPTSKIVVKEISTDDKNGLTNFTVVADLTIKDKTNEVSIPVEVYNEDNEFKMVGLVNIDRTLWDIKYGSDKFFDSLGDNIIDDNIAIEFEVYTEK